MRDAVMRQVEELVSLLYFHLLHLFTWHPFAVLAVLPGAIAIVSQLNAAKCFEKTEKAIEAFLKRKAKAKKKAYPVFLESFTDLEEYRPSLRMTIVGALFLTAVF